MKSKAECWGNCCLEKTLENCSAGSHVQRTGENSHMLVQGDGCIEYTASIHLVHERLAKKPHMFNAQ